MTDAARRRCPFLRACHAKARETPAWSSSSTLGMFASVARARPTDGPSSPYAWRSTQAVSRRTVREIHTRSDCILRSARRACARSSFVTTRTSMFVSTAIMERLFVEPRARWRRSSARRFFEVLDSRCNRVGPAAWTRAPGRPGAAGRHRASLQSRFPCPLSIPAWRAPPWAARAALCSKGEFSWKVLR